MSLSTFLKAFRILSNNSPGTYFFFCSQGGALNRGRALIWRRALNTNAWCNRAVTGEERFPNITWFQGFYSIAHYATQMFCQKSDSALSSSCCRADFRGTRVWTCSQLNSWASIKWRGRGGGGGGRFKYRTRMGRLIKGGRLFEKIRYSVVVLALRRCVHHMQVDE